MFASLVLAPLLAAQVVFEPRPAPPPPAAPDSAWFKEQQEYARRDLALQCFSPAGIDIILAARARTQAAVSGGPQQWRIHEQAVAQAAWADSFDAEALAQAVSARAAFRAEREIRQAEADLELLNALSAKDQALFAHRMTTEVQASYVKPC